MKLRKGEWMLFSLLLIFLAFAAGFFFGGREHPDSISVYLERSGEDIPVEALNSEASASVQLDIFSDPEIVNINTATREELMFLPGIGGKRADDIIAYREANGPFTQIEDIMNVSGIGEKMFSELSGRIAVE